METTIIKTDKNKMVTTSNLEKHITTERELYNYSVSRRNYGESVEFLNYLIVGKETK